MYNNSSVSVYYVLIYNNTIMLILVARCHIVNYVNCFEAHMKHLTKYRLHYYHYYYYYHKRKHQLLLLIYMTTESVSGALMLTRLVP